MIYAVTGGTGFIGHDVVQAILRAGHNVRMLSRRPQPPTPGISHFIGDVTVPNEQLAAFVKGADVVVHCAGQIQDEGTMRSVHTVGTQNLISEAIGNVGRWVQLSSVGAYGPNKGVITEATPPRPAGMYEITKTESDDIVRNSGIPFAILRPSIVFGNGMSNRSLYQLVWAIDRRLYFHIGKAGATVNYVHVTDVTNALLACSTDPRALGQTFILSQTTDTDSMVEAICLGLNISRKPIRFPLRPVRRLAQILGRLPRSPLTITRVDALTRRNRYDSSKISRVLDFQFDAPLEQHFRNFAAGKAPA